MGDKESDGGEGNAPRQPEDVIRLTDQGSTFQDALSRIYGDESNPNVELHADSAERVVSARISKLGAEGQPHQRYILKGEVGRGGMGAVLSIFDSDLRRNLAMKVVLGSSDKASGDTPQIEAQQVLRFIEEAQVTGQLDHPGVVPVHELGVDADGRVYFTMRL
ncbi:MAG: serine/threonine protein kinase, partial [Planctomycetota bacterium]